MPRHMRTRAFAGDIRAGQETHVLLAMQKVVGSNPISRFAKGLHLQVFFVGAVALFVCIRSD
jgi:hypothetical protein